MFIYVIFRGEDIYPVICLTTQMAVDYYRRSNPDEYLRIVKMMTGKSREEFRELTYQE